MIERKKEIFRYSFLVLNICMFFAYILMIYLFKDPLIVPVTAAKGVIHLVRMDDSCGCMDDP